jgi:hypothetical protein
MNTINYFTVKPSENGQVRSMKNRLFSEELSSLSQMKSILRDLSSELTQQQLTQNLEFVSRLVTPNTMLRILRSIRCQPSELNKVAACSYHHFNDFDKIVLVDSSELRGYRLTIHLWSPPFLNTKTGHELIHAHRFNFWSGVLFGELVSEEFHEASLDASDNKYQCYRYMPELNRSLAFRDFYKLDSTVNLTPRETKIFQSGTCYYMSAPTIHRIILNENTHSICTIVLRGSRLHKYSRVYSKSYPNSDVSLSNKMFSPEELDSKLQEIEIGIIKRAAN